MNPPFGNSKPSNFGKPRWTVHISFIECVMLDSDLLVLVACVLAAAHESCIKRS